MKAHQSWVLPAPWAPYLINGDESSLDAAETIEIDDWLEKQGLADCVGCSGDATFSWHNEGPNPSLGGDVMTYLFRVRS